MHKNSHFFFHIFNSFTIFALRKSNFSKNAIEITGEITSVIINQ